MAKLSTLQYLDKALGGLREIRHPILTRLSANKSPALRLPTAMKVLPKPLILFAMTPKPSSINMPTVKLEPWKKSPTSG